jgi:class 3 adenylate cyclase
MTWSIESSRARIADANEAARELEVVPFKRELSLEDIPANRAYVMDAAHLYIEMLDAASLVDTDKSESERSHKRVLRFLNIYQRVAHVIFSRTDAHRVDFQNQRLHLVVYKPYDNAADRVRTAVALAQLFQQVIRIGSGLHEEFPGLKLSLGIEAGQALVVTNGTRGDREPLFLGNPANRAAKLLRGRPGILLGANARASLGAAWASGSEGNVLSAEDVGRASQGIELGVSPDTLVKHWQTELAEHSLSDIAFSRPTPPLSSLDLDTVTPATSRRLNAVSIHADVDGFTAFVEQSLKTGQGAMAARVMHVIRKELRDVLNDFGGLKIRYIGDCLHGILAEGVTETDAAQSISDGVRCAGAMRDAFAEIQKAIPEAGKLGLAIGLDYGPVSLSRLGVKNNRARCAVGQAVIGSEQAQSACSGVQTALGAGAREAASDGIRKLFPGGKPASGVTYNRVVLELRDANDPTIKYVRTAAAAPAVVRERAFAEG